MAVLDRQVHCDCYSGHVVDYCSFVVVHCLGQMNSSSSPTLEISDW